MTVRAGESQIVRMDMERMVEVTASIASGSLSGGSAAMMESFVHPLTMIVVSNAILILDYRSQLRR